MARTAAQRKVRTQKTIAAVALSMGVLASVGANYLAAEGGVVSRVIAVWPALALLASVYLFEHAPRNWMVKLGIFAVAAVAAWMSYWHMVEVVGQYETTFTAHIFPASVDGMIYMASVVLTRKPAPATRRTSSTGKTKSQNTKPRGLKAA